MSRQAGDDRCLHSARYSRYVNSCYSDQQLNAEDLASTTHITKIAILLSQESANYFPVPLFPCSLNRNERPRRNSLESTLPEFDTRSFEISNMQTRVKTFRASTFRSFNFSNLGNMCARVRTFTVISGIQLFHV